MEVLFILVPLSIVFVALIGVMLVWAVKSGQYDDMERARYQILLDDDDAPGAEDAKPAGVNDDEGDRQPPGGDAT